MIPPKPSIFISYGRGDDDEDYHNADKSFLRRLYTHLTADGYNVWWDRESMPSRGLTFMQEIQNAITQHDKLILIIGPHARSSDYVRYEWEYALRICKPIIPILLKRDPAISKDKDQFKQVPDTLGGLHTVNALDWEAGDKFILVCDELKRILGEDAPLGETHNLPLPPRGYIERDGFAKLQQGLLIPTQNPVVIAPHEQIVSVQGTGGIGKSTLAAALGWSCAVRRQYVDGIYWITLGKPNETDVVSRQAMLGRQLGDDGSHYTDMQSGLMRLSHHLADKKALLILDDVWEFEQTKAFNVLGANCRMLITTRQRYVALKMSGEPHQLDKLTEDEGVRLIAKWLEQDEGRAILNEDLERQIVRELDGYTLAIAIAAAKLADTKTGYTHASLLKRLQDGRLFKDIKLDENDKNYNLERSLFLSYEDLSEADRIRFCQLGVLAPSTDFDMSLIQAVWDDDEYDTEDALNRLVSAALLDRDEGGRWSQHTVLRLYASGLLDEGTYYGVFMRYVEYITTIADFNLPMEKWDTQVGPYYPHIDYIGDNLIKRYAQQPDIYLELTGNFIFAVRRYITKRPVLRYVEQERVWRGLDWLKLGATIYGKLNYKARQKTTFLYIGLVYHSLGDKYLALDFYKQALPICREMDDHVSKATTLSNIGAVYQALNDSRQALRHYEQALPILREIGVQGKEATILNNMGELYRMLGDTQKALSHFKQALPILVQLGHKYNVAICLNNIGAVYDELNNIQEALSYYEQALMISREVGNRFGEATTLNNTGKLYRVLGDIKRALSYYQQALLIRREVGDRAGEATTCYNIALIYGGQGDLDTAIEYLERTVMLEQEIQDPHWDQDRQLLEQLKRERDEQSND